MKILGGSFGLSGSADLKQGLFIINTGNKTVYDIDQIKAVEAKSQKEKKFAPLSAILGIIIFGAIFTMLAGPIGTIFGIAIGIVGSFYSTKENSAIIRFDDGKFIELSASKSTINQITNMI